MKLTEANCACSSDMLPSRRNQGERHALWEQCLTIGRSLPRLRLSDPVVAQLSIVYTAPLTHEEYPGEQLWRRPRKGPEGASAK